MGGRKAGGEHRDGGPGGGEEAMRDRSRRRHAGWSLAASCAALASTHAFGCGACDEDKIAATYDHRLVTEAAVRGDAVVFCAATGSFDQHRLREAARRVRGIRVSSVRSSNEPATVSFALDLSLQSPHAAVASLQRALPSPMQLTLLRVVTPLAR
jgi:uncharacterized protein (DUF1800 family)